MHGKIETRVGMLVLAAITLFVYMGFQLGAFRLNQNNYSTYTVSCADVSGITPKSGVKIAGVKVGWVSDVQLSGACGVCLTLMIKNDYHLYQDACALIRQEGFLGPKHIDIIPGNPSLPRLVSGALLGQPCSAPVCVDQVIDNCNRIAVNMQQITESFKDVLAGQQGAAQLGAIMTNLQETTKNLATFSAHLEKSYIHNESNIDSLFEMGNHVRRLSETLTNDVLPAFQLHAQHLSSAVNQATGTMQDTCVQAQETFKNVAEISGKINKGTGLLGKLVNEEDTYRDLKDTLSGVKNYLYKAGSMEIVFDAHSEFMLRRAENYQHRDNKNFFAARIHPNTDYFYLLQVNSSERGYASRVEVQQDYFDRCNVPISPAELHETFDVEQFFERRQTVFHRYNWRVGLQLGKIFGPVALRGGIFENTVGFALDFDIPFNTDAFRWVTSFEIFEMTGWNRRNDRSPHLKWLNRVFLLNNIYFVFGADDFISKHNSSFFFGGGIRFGDDDFQYLLSTLPANFMTGTLPVQNNR